MMIYNGIFENVILNNLYEYSVNVNYYVISFDILLIILIAITFLRGAKYSQGMSQLFDKTKSQSNVDDKNIDENVEINIKEYKFGEDGQEIL